MSNLTLKPGISYQNIWYKSSPVGNNEVYGATLGSEYEMTNKLFITSDYAFGLTESKANESKTHSAQAGLKYEFAKDSFIEAEGGYSWYTASGATTGNPLWSFSANYAGDLYKFKAGVGEKYTTDPLTNKGTLVTNYDLAFDWILNKGSLGLVSGISNIKTMPDNTISSISYNNTANLLYTILPDWDATVSYTFNFIDIRYSQTFTKVSICNVGLKYAFRTDTTISFNYANTHMYSPVIESDNKDINSCTIQISKTF